MTEYMGTYIRYSDLYEEIVPLEGLTNILKSFKFTECLNFLSKIQILLSGDQYSQDFQFELSRRVFFGEALQDLLEELKVQLSKNGPKLVLVLHDRQVYNLLALVLLNCQNRVKRSMDEPTVRNKFTQCFLIMNDHLEPIDQIENIGQLPLDKQRRLFIELCIRNLSFSNQENLAHLLVRFYELFFEIPDFLTQSNINIANIFLSRTGLSLPEYFALGLSIWSHYSSLNLENINESPIHIDTNNYFENTNLTKKQINKILKDLCANRKEFNKAYAEELSSARTKEYSFLTLKNKPLLKVGNNIYSLSHKYLGEKITEGVYYTILSALQTEEQRQEFLNYFGNIFEIYVKSIFKRIYPEVPPLQRFYSDIFYGRDNKEAGDGIIVYDDSLIIIEIKSSRLLASTMVSGDLSEYEDKLDKVIIKGAKTIDRVIKDFQKGLIPIDGLRKEEIRCFYPLIVTLQFFPQNNLLWEIIENKLQSENCLQDSNIARLQIMEVEILEKLESVIASGRSFLSILKEKDANQIYRDYSFSNFMYSVPYLRNVEHNQYIKDKFEIIENEMKSIIFHQ